jgi:hypothetical protein
MSLRTPVFKTGAIAILPTLRGVQQRVKSRRFRVIAPSPEIAILRIATRATCHFPCWQEQL